VKATIICLILLTGLLSTCVYAEKIEVIKVKVNEEFTVTLESNPTTGYVWQIARPIDNKVIKLIGSKFIPAQTKLIGAGGQEAWTFKALKPGKAGIYFKYVRPWEKDDSSAKKRKFVIIVQA
jgi:inhibitor of cysteine peptidase